MEVEDLFTWVCILHLAKGKANEKFYVIRVLFCFGIFLAYL